MWGLGDQTRGVTLGDKYFNLLSHLASPMKWIKALWVFGTPVLVHSQSRHVAEKCESYPSVVYDLASLQ